MLRTRRGRVLTALVTVGAILVVGGVAGLLIGKRIKSGKWAMPTGDDLVHITDLVRRRDRPAEPPRIIYLHKGAITVAGGVDDAAARLSSVVASGGMASHHHGTTAGPAGAARVQVAAYDLEHSEHIAKLRGFRGSKKSWGQIVKCVKDLFAPFDVVVTDVEPPAGQIYDMVVVGGRARDIGHQGKVGGLAPYNGDVIPGAVVFAFSDELGNRARATCEVIGMEVAHAFGLDHSFECKDVMTYKSGCGNKAFVDKDAPCGESKARPCGPEGTPTQNSYRRLMAVFGPKKKPPTTTSTTKR